MKMYDSTLDERKIFPFSIEEIYIKTLNNEYIDWRSLPHDYHLTYKFIKEFQDKLHWETISIEQRLTIDFIREFKDKVNWECISVYQELNEESVIEFGNYVDWDLIFIYQNITDKFIQCHKNKVNVERIKQLIKEAMWFDHDVAERCSYLYDILK